LRILYLAILADYVLSGFGGFCTLTFRKIECLGVWENPYLSVKQMNRFSINHKIELWGNLTKGSFYKPGAFVIFEIIITIRAFGWHSKIAKGCDSSVWLALNIRILAADSH